MTGRSSCPECGTILRIRDRSFVGRKFSCPECKTALRVEAADRDGEYIAKRIEFAQASKPGSQVVKNIPITVPAVVSKRSLLSRVLHSRITVAGLLLIAGTSLVAVLMSKSRTRVIVPLVTANQIEPDPAQQSAEVADTRRQVQSSPTESVPTVAAADPTPAIPTLPIPTTIDDRDSISALQLANTQPESSLPVVSNLPEPPAPAKPKIDVAGKMTQKLVSYKQPKVARRLLLDSLEEQLGAPIRYDAEDLGTGQLEEKVSFNLENTTIGAVIEHVAKEAGWQIDIEDTGLRLKRKPSSPDPS